MRQKFSPNTADSLPHIGSNICITSEEKLQEKDTSKTPLSLAKK
jgi:hypothetical protein